MMRFREIAKALTATLNKAAAGRFTVTGYEGQGVSAREVRGNKRNVQVFYSEGNFPRSGRQQGPADHHMEFTIGLTVSAAARLNLAVITQPGATSSQIADALAAGQEAAAVADESMDELMELVYQILMDNANYDLGLPIGTVGSRWVESIKKDPPISQGTLVMLTGAVTYACQTVEDIVGDYPVAMGEGIVVDLIVDTDPAPAGVEIHN